MPDLDLSISERTPLDLKYALLVYEGDGIAITKNPITDGKIGIGKPIDVGELIEEFNRGKDKEGKMTHYAGRDRSPIGRLVWVMPTLLAENSSYRLWWTPPETRTLFIAGKPRRCWLPLLIWAGHRRQRSCFLFSAVGSKKPTLKTVVWRPQFGPLRSDKADFNHIHANSQICLGNMDPKGCSPQEWMEAFYDTSFKTADGLPAKPHDITKTYKRLGSLADAIAKLSPDGSADQ